VRVVAATNRDLEADVQAGRFRRDLYYRLKVLELRVPPLAERRGDIPLLAHHFLHRFAERGTKTVRGFTQEAMRRLVRHPWPGNVRQLEHTIERAVILSRDEVDISTALLPEELQSSAAPTELEPGPLREAVAALERRLIVQALARSGGNRTHAARALGMTVRNLQKKLVRYSIS